VGATLVPAVPVLGGSLFGGSVLRAEMDAVHRPRALASCETACDSWHLIVRTRNAPGGGIVVEVEPPRLIGWVNRFAGRNDGLAAIEAADDAVTLRAVDGTTALVAVPFPPMSIGAREPLEAVLAHVAGLGAVGILAVRGGAHSVGIARAGVVVSSSTDRAYLQGRTAAGGWSQQRYARRRGNQLTASLADAADAAARVLVPAAKMLDALVVAGDAAGMTRVLTDPRLAPLLDLPRREFRDVPEPRRTLLDDLAVRLLTVEITVRDRVAAAEAAGDGAAG
jgi:Actinobacteria/chloroflexi VLRF1 release factor